MTRTTVADAMTPNPQTLDVDDPPSRALKLLSFRAFHHLPVLDDGRLIGIVSNLDLARVALRTWVRDGATDGVWLDCNHTIADIMTSKPTWVTDDQPLRDAAELLAGGGFHCLPVLDADERLVGVLTTTDLAQRLASDTDSAAESRTETPVLSELADELRVQAWLGSKEMVSPSDGGDQVRDEVQVLARIRDSMRLQIHLGRLDATERWSELEAYWHRLMHGGLRTDANATLREADDELRGLLGQMRTGYRAIRARWAASREA